MTTQQDPPPALPRRDTTVTFTVNRESRTVTVPARTLLVDVLRHHLGLTGTHVGCEQGACGACTVLVDGHPTRSCLVLAPQADGTVVETIEGLSVHGPTEGNARSSAHRLHAVAEALHDHHGLQCGFCTPGIVVSLIGAERAGSDTAEVLDDVLGGHLCRCTGYVNIRAAIVAAFGADPTSTGAPA